MRAKGFPLCLAIQAIVFILAAGSSLASEDVRQKYNTIQREIKRQEEKLRESKRREHSVLAELEGIEKGLADRRQDVEAHRRKLAATNAEIARTRAEMTATQQMLERHREWLKRKLRGLQRQGRSDEIVMLLGADDMAGFLRRWRYLEVLARKERDSLEAFQNALDRLKEQEEKLTMLEARLKREEAAARRAQARLEEKREDRRTLLASVRSEKASYQRMLDELKEASEQLMSIIRRAESGDGYAGKGFRALKGRLSWPVNGAIALNYGRQLDPTFGTPIFRNGIHIKTAAETIARAVHEGKVVYADWFKGYGQLVIVSHGDGYHSLYGNLDEIFLKVGDIIKKQTAIGRVGESLMINAPALYFELRYKGKPLNPTQWLGKD